MRHIRRGTLIERIGAPFGRAPEHVGVHWNGAESHEQAARALSRWALDVIELSAPGGWVMSVGDGEALHAEIDRKLTRRNVPFRSLSLQQAIECPPSELTGLRGIVCGYADAASQTRVARTLAAHPTLGSAPFEYAAGVTPEQAQFAQQDEYRKTWFVSPNLLDEPSPYALYAESLERFEQKCGLRDYLDLYQLLRHVVDNEVPGDIAEFGSYQGHSGYLIARTLQALRSDKRVYMFDAFEEFPTEARGVDHFWSRTHQVDFSKVQARLAGMPNVRLIKGDFTETLAQSGLDAVALAYIDCDSYRATRFLIDALLPVQLSRNGLLVCEDYGHPALLGNRAAVHESLDGRPGLFRYFSQFSGYYVALKL